MSLWGPSKRPVPRCPTPYAVLVNAPRCVGQRSTSRLKVPHKGLSNATCRGTVADSPLLNTHLLPREKVCLDAE